MASVRLSIVVHNFKDLLRNHLADQVKILCGATLGSGIQILNFNHDSLVT